MGWPHNCKNTVRADCAHSTLLESTEINFCENVSLLNFKSMDFIKLDSHETNKFSDQKSQKLFEALSS